MEFTLNGTHFHDSTLTLKQLKLSSGDSLDVHPKLAHNYITQNTQLFSFSIPDDRLDTAESEQSFFSENNQIEVENEQLEQIDFISSFSFAPTLRR